ncbi:MAG: hypothetical protein WCB12_06220, partial [Bryobacteraceae bacterium]
PTAPATTVYSPENEQENPAKGARHCANQISALQAHSWIRKCYRSRRTGESGQKPTVFLPKTKDLKPVFGQDLTKWPTEKKGQRFTAPAGPSR